MSIAKSILLKVLTLRGVAASLAPWARGRATVLMMHRFQDRDLGLEGHAPHQLRAALAYLRRQRFELTTLRDVFQRLAGDGPPLHRTVAFTLDDGYLEQARVAAPIFAEFDCPTTTFVTTDFLDGKIWFWWDQIAYVFQNTRRSSASLTLGSEELLLRWTEQGELARAQELFSERCKRVSDLEKHAAIERLALALEVEIPRQPPPAYAPMSWEDLRRCEALGMEFGPHTLTHPVLSLTTDEQSEREIRASWERLQSESASPLPIFCYPNGQSEDFGPREIGILRKLGFLGAVVGVPGYAEPRAFAAHPDGRFTVRRFAFPDSVPHVAQLVTGFEALKARLRGGAAA